MKLQVALSFLLFACNLCHSQTALKTYTWEEAQKQHIDSVFSITFEKEKIDSLPIALMSYTQLKKLDLSKQKIKSLTEDFPK